ncbi:MAG: hypothetical protein KFF72_12945 [Arthrospira sp. SH-MAG29]|nr:hypothetical protein [Arthrospira sp. SH-MAG29]MBS0017234.1 hypothetical protein [Arthrospira sp. SH-MAG29]
MITKGCFTLWPDQTTAIANLGLMVTFLWLLAVDAPYPILANYGGDR